jgi:hypothetical protein
MKLRILLAVAAVLHHSSCFDRKEFTHSAKTTKMPSLYDLEAINIYNTCTLKTFTFVDIYLFFTLWPFTH